MTSVADTVFAVEQLSGRCSVQDAAVLCAGHAGGAQQVAWKVSADFWQVAGNASQQERCLILHAKQLLLVDKLT